MSSPLHAREAFPFSSRGDMPGAALLLRPCAGATLPASPAGRLSPAAAFLAFFKSAHGAVLPFGFSRRRFSVLPRGHLPGAALPLRPCADAAIPASPAGQVVASLAAAFYRFLKSAHGAVLQLWQIRTVCGFAFLFALPCLAEEGARNVVMLDVASGGLLGALATAVIVWLNNQRKRDSEADRQPPLGEDVARNFVMKEEFTRCQTTCRKDITDIRDKLADIDKKAEDRSRGTHARIDKIYIAQEQTNKALGTLTGIMVGRGIAPMHPVLPDNIVTEK